MATSAWLSWGSEITCVAHAARMIDSTIYWQLYRTIEGGYALVATGEIVARWAEEEYVSGISFKQVSLGREEFFACAVPDGKLISSSMNGPYPCIPEHALQFSEALRAARARNHDTPLQDAVFVEGNAMLLPSYLKADKDDDRLVLGRWLSGGVNISTDSEVRLRQLVGWMPAAKLSQIIENKTTQHGIRSNPDAPFSLPGRPKLEVFFNEHVVDILRHEDEYEKMGVGFPAGILLHGLPGCGKTYAVEKLIEHLGWPSFSVDSGSIGSTYIHETSKKIAEIFEAAAAQAPSILVIDEMEAFLTKRAVSGISGQHHIEEVAEFLRRIPEAAKKRILVIAMTNMIDSIDPAILRRGRFDHVIRIDMPCVEEISAMMRHMLKGLPVRDDLNVSNVACLLQGHPISDVAFVIKEAGRLCVKAGVHKIDEQALRDAFRALPNTEN